MRNVLTARYQDGEAGFPGQDDAVTQHAACVTVPNPSAEQLCPILEREPPTGGPMPRMWLAALALISLAACGGSSPRNAASAGTRTRTAHGASRAQTSTAKSRQQQSKAKRKTSTKPDTAQRNPLVNHQACRHQSPAKVAGLRCSSLA